MARDADSQLILTTAQAKAGYSLSEPPRFCHALPRAHLRAAQRVWSEGNMMMNGVAGVYAGMEASCRP
jgi:hypothetical protein